MKSPKLHTKRHLWSFLLIPALKYQHQTSFFSPTAQIKCSGEWAPGAFSKQEAFLGAFVGPLPTASHSRGSKAGFPAPSPFNFTVFGPWHIGFSPCFGHFVVLEGHRVPSSARRCLCPVSELHLTPQGGGRRKKRRKKKLKHIKGVNKRLI